MKVRPIIFQGAMVRALLDGRKTQTRRAVKPQPQWRDVGPGLFDSWVFPKHAGSAGGLLWPNAKDEVLARCPYGKPGDLLYVRETWLAQQRMVGGFDATGPGIGWKTDRNSVVYRADGWKQDQWRPSIHMPRWASRLTLQLTEVRVERVQEISEADAEAEGVKVCPKPDDRGGRPCYVWPDSEYDRAGLCHSHADTAFSRGWDSINAARGYGWSENPWVWALTFNVIHAHVDDVLAEPERYLPATNRSETA